MRVGCDHHEAVTSGEAWAALRGRADEANALREELEDVRRELKRKPTAAALPDPEVRVAAVNGVNLVVDEVDDLEGDELLEL